jgi:DNA helicase-2/ATP-dependent DNA helicase PcrA
MPHPGIPSAQERDLLDALMRMLGSAPVPVFGALKIRTQRERWLLVGERQALDHRPPVLSWRDSPLACLLFTCRAGEDFELLHGDRVIEGRVLERWRLGLRAGALAWVDSGTRRIERRADGAWRPSHQEAGGLELDQRPQRRTGLVVPAEQLDPQQRAVLDAPHDSVLLVRGAAGSGKTTACLRRVVTVLAGSDTLSADDVSIVVPEDGLARQARQALVAMGADIHPRTWEGWLREHGARCFPQLPAHVCSQTPARVRRFFRHPALLDSLPAWVEERCDALLAELDRRLFARGAVLGLWHEHRVALPLQALRRCERAWRRRRHREERRRIAAHFGLTRRELTDLRPAWRDLWQDRRLLERAASRSGGELGPADVQAVLDHAWLQASEPSEQAWAHVDPERLETVDGLGLDDGTPDEVAGTIDLEAYTVLLALRCLMLGPPRAGETSLGTCGLLLVDELQERAPIELSVLADGLQPGGGLCAVGDAAQRLSGSQACSLDEIVSRAGLGVHHHIQLQQAHRATVPLVRFCHDLLGPLARGPCPSARRPGPPVRVDELEGEGAVVAALADALAARPGDRFELAVITANAQRARQIARTLDELHPCALCLDGLFDTSRHKLWVTTVDQVGGLEFDTVWIPDADSGSYPLRDGARRRLYVACTRARRRLWLLSPGPPSRILEGCEVSLPR